MEKANSVATTSATPATPATSVTSAASVAPATSAASAASAAPVTSGAPVTFAASPATATSATLASAAKRQRVVVASNNAGKLREFAALLGEAGFDLITQGELGVPEAEEPHATFVENALEKARHASRLTGLPALADDSGLCVRALHGAPGVYSARYALRAGGEKSDAANNRHLLAELAGKDDRRGHYVCVLAFVEHADDPEPIIGAGRWFGEIVETPRGDHGFGYDPLFYLPDQGKTAAELSPEVKNSVSHRAIALRHLMTQLKERE